MTSLFIFPFKGNFFMFIGKALNRTCKLGLLATGALGFGGVAFGQVPNGGTCNPVLRSDPNTTFEFSNSDSESSINYELSDGTFDWKGQLTIRFAEPSDVIIVPTSHIDTNDVDQDGNSSEQVAAWNFYSYYITNDDGSQSFYTPSRYTTDGGDWTYTPGTEVDMNSDQNGVQRYALDDNGKTIRGGDAGTVTFSNQLWGAWGTSQAQTLTFNGNGATFKICYYDQTPPTFTEGADADASYYDHKWESGDGTVFSYHFYRNENAEGVLFEVEAADDSGGAVTYSLEESHASSDFELNTSTGALNFASPPNYEVPSSNAGISTNDQSYRVDIVASDSNGNSATQEHVVYIFDTVVPSAPRDLVVVENNGVWDLTWKAPETDGASDYSTLANNGSAITGYQVSTDGGATFVDVDYTENGGTYSTTLSSLGNGTVQDVRLRAKNDDYADHVSGSYDDNNSYQVEDYATPVDAPDAPTGLTAAQGDDGALVLTWTPPTNTGDSEIQNYAISTDGGLNFGDDITSTTDNGDGTVSYTLLSLTNGVTADLQVKAGNAAGYGAATESYTITPASRAPAGASSYSGTCEPIWSGDPNVSFAGGNDSFESDVDGYYKFTTPLEFSFTSPLDLVLVPHHVSTDANFETGSSYVTGGGSWVHTLGDDSVSYALDGQTISGAQSDDDPANSAWGHFDTEGTSSLSLTPKDTDAVRLCRIPEDPEVPTNLDVDAGDGELTISWVNPRDDGGPDIEYYGISINDGGSFTDVAVDELTVEDIDQSALKIYTYTIDTGVVNGDEYKVQVRAQHNAASSGEGLGQATASVSANPVGEPTEPTIDSVQVGDGYLTITFTPGSLEGGTFSRYEAATRDDFLENPVSTTNVEDRSLTIPGLDNDSPYTVYLRTVNSVGNGPEASSGPHTPIGAPSAPTIGDIIAGATTLEVNFEPVAFEDVDGKRFKSYQIATSPDFDPYEESTNETETSFTLTGLSGGTNYTVYLRAENESGVFSEVVSKEAETELIHPDTPTIDTITPGNGSLTVTFTPGDLYGLTFDSYQASVNGDFASSVFESTDVAKPEITITGLEGGTPYFVYVRTVAKELTSVTAVSTTTATPTAGTPDAPEIKTVTGGDGSLIVEFEPGNLGGAKFEKYEADIDSDFDSAHYVSTTDEDAASLTISGLADYTSYTVYMRTHNEEGPGSLASATGSTDPAEPAAPTDVSLAAGDGTLTVNFTPGALNSSSDDFVKYQAALDEDFSEGLTEGTVQDTHSLILENLSSDTEYTVYVRTENAYGVSEASSVIGQPTAAAPNEPIIDAITATRDGTLTITFTPGSLNGGVFESYQASRDSGFATEVEETNDVDARSLTISGLNSFTEYTLYLRTVTKVGETSYESPVVSGTAATNATTSLTESKLVSSASSLVANGEARLTITLESYDVNGDRVTTGGNDVVFATSLGTIGAAVDAEDGTYSASLTAGRSAGTAIVTASVNGAVLSHKVEIDFTSNPFAVDTGSALSSQVSSLNVGGAFSAIVNAGTGGGLSGGSSGAGAAAAGSGGAGASAGSGGASSTADSGADSGGPSSTADSGADSGGPSSTADAGTDGGVDGGADSGGEEVAARDPGDYGRLQILSARETEDGFSLVDWFTWGISDASVDAELKGDGIFGYAMVGTELLKTENSVAGLLYGAETSRWNYDEESDVDRTGISVGVYGGRRFKEIELNGSAILTASANDFTSTSGATADANSTRLMLTASVRGEAEAFGDGGGTLTPLFNLLYAHEETESFTYSDGTVSDAGTSAIGKMSGGIEYMSAAHPKHGRYLVRGEVGRVFGAETVTLSDGSEYTPNEGLAGSVTFGWIPKATEDGQARIELTIGELGNGENSEVRLDGSWDRRY